MARNSAYPSGGTICRDKKSCEVFETCWSHCFEGARQITSVDSYLGKPLVGEGGLGISPVFLVTTGGPSKTVLNRTRTEARFSAMVLAVMSSMLVCS